MAGTKGKSGGARTPRDPATAKKRGPLIVSNRDAPFDKEHARALKILILATGQAYTAETVRDFLSRCIKREYEDYEASLAPDLEAEGYIL